MDARLIARFRRWTMMAVGRLARCEIELHEQRDRIFAPTRHLGVAMPQTNVRARCSSGAQEAQDNWRKDRDLVDAAVSRQAELLVARNDLLLRDLALIARQLGVQLLVDHLGARVL